jgi:internalin A
MTRCCLRLALFLALGCLMLDRPARAASPFADKNLEAGVRAALHLDEKAELTDEKLKDLFILEAPGKEIADLAGLEKCPNLALLKLSQNKIVKLDPLKGLTNLQSLDLSDKQIEDIEPLKHLTGLQYLALDNNKVSKL